MGSGFDALILHPLGLKPSACLLKYGVRNAFPDDAYAPPDLPSRVRSR